MTVKTITNRAFLRKFAKKVDSFPDRDASAEYFGFSKEYLYSVRKGKKPPNEQIQSIMGFRMIETKPPVIRRFEVVGND